MTDSIFRKEALTGWPIRSGWTRRCGWWRRRTGCCSPAFAALVAAALVWAGATLAPVKVAGRGILIDRAGLSEIVAGDAGQIAAVTVAAGDSVVRGQPIAVLSAASSSARSPTRGPPGPGPGPAGAAQRYYADQTRSEGSADSDRLASIGRTRAELDRRRLALEEECADRGAGAARLRRPRHPDRRARRPPRRASGSATSTTKRRGCGSRASAAPAATGWRCSTSQTGIEQLERELSRLQARAGDQTIVRAQSAGR